MSDRIHKLLKLVKAKSDEAQEEYDEYESFDSYDDVIKRQFYHIWLTYDDVCNIIETLLKEEK